MTTFTIFGHTGFIGSHLKERLKKHKLILPKRNQFKVEKFLGNIIYCIGSDNWATDQYNSFKANVGFIPEITCNNNFNSFTFLSTTRIYKNAKDTKEDSSFDICPKNTDDYYNIKKILGESFLLSQKKKFNIIRLSNIYGDNYKSPLVLPRLINDAIKIKKINLTINKNSKKDFLSINDAVEIIYKISKVSKGEIYNVASGKMYSLIEIAKEIQKYTECKIILKNQYIKVKEPKININKIRKKFNFKPKLDLLNELNGLIIKFKNYYGYKL